MARSRKRETEASAPTGGAGAVVVAGGLAALSLAFLFLLRWNDLSPSQPQNPSLLEARSLAAGEIALPERVHDTAWYEGRVLNVFQPGQTLYFLAHLLLAGERALAGFQVELFLVFLATTALLGLALCRLTGGRAVMSALLAVSTMFGAPYIASLPMALSGSVYRINHVLSLLFVAAFLALLDRRAVDRRPVLVGACVAAAMVFRVQNVLLLLLPLSFLFQDSDGKAWRLARAIATPAARRATARRAAQLMAVPALAVLVVAGFQFARFHDPFETGYAYLYVGRDDYLARRANAFGLFSSHFISENLFRTFVDAPGFAFDGWRFPKVVGDPRGNSLLFSQPVLLLAPFLVRSLRAARVQSFVLVAVLLAVPVWLYHNPGLFAPGYARLSLDYLLPWMAAVAVMSAHLPDSKGRRWLAAFATAWAVLYGVALLRTGVS